MAVLAEGTSVFVCNEVIEARLNGGVENFKADCPNHTFCTDGEVCRVGFMIMEDAIAYVRQLQSLGFTPLRSGKSQDMVISNPECGFLWPCEWLEFDNSGSLAAVRSIGSRLTGIAVASDEQDFESHIVSGTKEEFAAKYEYVRTEGGVETYRDRSTGEQVYVGRTMHQERQVVSTEAEQAESLLREAIGIVEDKVNGPPSGMFKRLLWNRQMKQALVLLNKCTKTAPSIANAHY